jgi:hypothetical protein
MQPSETMPSQPAAAKTAELPMSTLQPVRCYPLMIASRASHGAPSARACRSHLPFWRPMKRLYAIGTELSIIATCSAHVHGDDNEHAWGWRWRGKLKRFLVRKPEAVRLRRDVQDICCGICAVLTACCCIDICC